MGAPPPSPRAHGCPELAGAERLAALYRLQTGEPGAVDGFAYFVHGRCDAPVTDPGQVDWDRFPVLAALEAVTTDELRRLREILADSDDDTTVPPYSRVQEKTPPCGLELGKLVTSSDG